MSEEDWVREGWHTESGRYTVEDWLKTYAAHAHNQPERQRTGDGLPMAADRVEHFAEAGERFGDTAADIRPVVRFRHRHDQHDLVDVGA